MAKTLSVAQAKRRFSDGVGAVRHGGQRFVIECRGTPVAAIVPVDDPVALEGKGGGRRPRPRRRVPGRQEPPQDPRQGGASALAPAPQARAEGGPVIVVDTDPLQATTTITPGEIAYGARKTGRPALYQRAVELLRDVRVLDFDRAAAERYGALRAQLERAGRRLPNPDLRIAAIVTAHRATLVTGNVRHFARIPGLAVEDWLR